VLTVWYSGATHHSGSDADYGWATDDGSSHTPTGLPSPGEPASGRRHEQLLLAVSTRTHGRIAKVDRLHGRYARARTDQYPMLFRGPRRFSVEGMTRPGLMCWIVRGSGTDASFDECPLPSSEQRKTTRDFPRLTQTEYRAPLPPPATATKGFFFQAYRHSSDRKGQRPRHTETPGAVLFFFLPQMGAPRPATGVDAGSGQPFRAHRGPAQTR